MDWLRKISARVVAIREEFRLQRQNPPPQSQKDERRADGSRLLYPGIDDLLTDNGYHAPPLHARVICVNDHLASRNDADADDFQLRWAHPRCKLLVRSQCRKVRGKGFLDQQSLHPVANKVLVLSPQALAVALGTVEADRTLALL
ncbi:hypothetical protein ACOJBO_04030 [Rhizobium beringeri]